MPALRIGTCVHSSILVNVACHLGAVRPFRVSMYVEVGVEVYMSPGGTGILVVRYCAIDETLTFRQIYSARHSLILHHRRRLPVILPAHQERNLAPI